MSTTANKVAFGSSTAIAITPGALAQAAARQSAAVDNTSNLFLDALVQFQVVIPDSAPGSDKVINIYVAGATAIGKWPGASATVDNVTGTDAGITLAAPTTLRLLGSISVTTQNLTYTSQPLSVAWAFGGTLPPYWSIIVENRTNVAFTTATGVLSYVGVYSTNA